MITKMFSFTETKFSAEIHNLFKIEMKPNLSLKISRGTSMRHMAKLRHTTQNAKAYHFWYARV